ncbi:MAG: prepilin-type N-terminal cleavage/methylation domain-containing protein [Candidatus Eisenbacteria bacterium]
MRTQAGFTFLELLTVLAIAGIFVLAGVPAPKTVDQSTGVRASAKQIAGDLWLARQKAITTSSPHSIRFQSGENRYVAFRDDGGGNTLNRANRNRKRRKVTGYDGTE